LGEIITDDINLPIIKKNIGDSDNIFNLREFFMKECLENLYNAATNHFKQLKYIYSEYKGQNLIVNDWINLAVNDWIISIDQFDPHSDLIYMEKIEKTNPIRICLSNYVARENHKDLELTLMFYIIDEKTILSSIKISGDINDQYDGYLNSDFDIELHYQLEENIYNTFSRTLNFLTKIAKNYNTQFILPPEEFKTIINRCVLDLI